MKRAMLSSLIGRAPAASMRRAAKLGQRRADRAVGLLCPRSHGSRHTRRHEKLAPGALCLAQRGWLCRLAEPIVEFGLPARRSPTAPSRHAVRRNIRRRFRDRCPGVRPTGAATSTRPGIMSHFAGQRRNPETVDDVGGRQLELQRLCRPGCGPRWRFRSGRRPARCSSRATTIARRVPKSSTDLARRTIRAAVRRRPVNRRTLRTTTGKTKPAMTMVCRLASIARSRAGPASAIHVAAATSANTKAARANSTQVSAAICDAASPWGASAECCSCARATLGSNSPIARSQRIIGPAIRWRRNRPRDLESAGRSAWPRSAA